MAEYVEREALKDAFWSACKNCLSEDDIADLIDDAPAADVAPVVHGRWIWDEGRRGYYCSHCPSMLWKSSDVPDAFKCCPVCGARMDGE